MKPLEKALNKYIKEQHTQEECVGFIDGYKEGIKSNKKYLAGLGIGILLGFWIATLINLYNK